MTYSNQFPRKKGNNNATWKLIDKQGNMQITGHYSLCNWKRQQIPLPLRNNYKIVPA